MGLTDRRRDPSDPSSRPRRTVLVVLAAAVAGAGVMAVVAIAARQGLGLGGSPERDSFVVPDIPTAFYYLVAVLEVVGLFGLLFVAVTSRNRPEEGDGALPRRSSWWAKAIALLVLLALFWLIAPLADRLGEHQTVPGSERTEASQRAEELPSSERPKGILSPSLGRFLTVLLGLVIVGLVAGLFFIFAKDERDPAEARERAPDGLRNDVQAGIDDLASIKDPRRAVIACYARMQRLLPSAGIVSRPSDTPFELLARILQQRNVARSSVTTLTESFERAKFSSHSIGESTRAEALAALRDIRDQLANGR